jgi:hypothetical protein
MFFDFAEKAQQPGVFRLLPGRVAGRAVYPGLAPPR